MTLAVSRASRIDARAVTPPFWRLVLHVYDVDPERGTVMIREGNGKRDPLIPIGERALFLALTGDSIGTRLGAVDIGLHQALGGTSPAGVTCSGT